MKPRGANRIPPASLSAAAPAHSQNQVVRSEAERTGLLRKAFRFCTSSNAMIPNAGKHLFKESLSAQPVGGFWIYSVVRTGQPHVLGELTHMCQLIPKRFFFCTVSGTFSFWQDKKKMWGTSPAAVRRILTGPVPLWEAKNMRGKA